MRVKLTRDYSCAPEGHTVMRFKAGDVLTGVAAELALADKAGTYEGPVEETKPAPAMERKRGRK